MPTFCIIKEKKKQVQPILGLETLLTAVLALSKNVHSVPSCMWCPARYSAENTKPECLSPAPSPPPVGWLLGEQAQCWWTNGIHIASTTQTWRQVLGTNVYRSVREQIHGSFIIRQDGVSGNHPKRTFPSKICLDLEGYCREAVYLLHSKLSLQVPGCKYWLKKPQ